MRNRIYQEELVLQKISFKYRGSIYDIDSEYCGVGLVVVRKSTNDFYFVGSSRLSLTDRNST